MKDDILRKACLGAIRFVKRNAPTILAIAGSAGVVGTVLFSSKAGIKAEERLKIAKEEKKRELTKLETVKAIVPVYIPTITIGAATIACILGSNLLNRKQQASLASAYAVLNNYHKKYREKLIELHGEEADKEIQSELARDCCNYHKLNLDTPDEKAIFYDEHTGNSVIRYEREIMDAEYHLNRNLVIRGYITLNEFCEFVGMPKSRDGWKTGWCIQDGYVWLDFEHRPIGRKNGMNVYRIDTIFPPEDLEEAGCV